MRSLVLAVAAVVAGMLAPTALAQAPTQDSVTFTGSFNQLSFDIAVRSGPSGENPTGRVLVTLNGGTFIDGPPSCVAVQPLFVGGPLGAVINVPIPPVGAGSVATFELTPFGPVDGRLEATISDRSPTDCSEVVFPLVSGEGQLVIVDAAPLPASKDECKNGGWQTFGVFKNQGDCVSFVATKGKNPPANSP
jgi:hypothetical protein